MLLPFGQILHYLRRTGAVDYLSRPVAGFQIITLKSMAISTAAHPANQNVLDALARCVAACEHCATACLGEENIKLMVPCIRLDRDCADICRLTAAFIARDSDHAPHVLRECIEICQKCHDECAQHQTEQCQACAAACKACVEACRTYN